MALVPVRCPGCGASVELEEGQSVVTCAYCGETSVLPGTRPIAEPRADASSASPSASAGPSRGGRLLLLIVALVVLGLGGRLAYKGGVGLSFVEGGPSVKAFLVDRLGQDARFVKIQFGERYLGAETIASDGSVVRQAFDGRSPREPQRLHGASAEDVAQAFSLEDIDLDVLDEIAHHATERQPDGRLAHLLVGRMTIDQADVLWLAAVEVAGEHRHWFYDLEGEPLVDVPRDFFAPEASWFSPLEKKSGPLRIVGVQLHADRASVRAMAPNSDRDTDEIALDTNGVVGSPRPDANGADPALLRSKVFKLEDVAWGVVPRVVADAAKKHDAEVQSVSIERAGGALVFKAHVRTKRGATQLVEYDGNGTPR